jgi:CRISPR-associated protein (TIGR03986 family)
MALYEVCAAKGEHLTLLELDSPDVITPIIVAADRSVAVGSVVNAEVVDVDGEFIAEIKQVIGTFITLTAKGKSDTWSLVGNGLTLSLAQAGGVSTGRVQALCARGGRFLLIDATATPAGRWENIRDVAVWEQGLDNEALAAALSSEMARGFVNPYTFVPWPSSDATNRREPAGHSHLAPDRFSGSVRVTGTTTTPLLIRGGVAPQTFPRRTRTNPHGGIDRELIVPGSSLKGAVRSLHETLVGGCLRVVDTEFVPVYRDSAAVKPESWQLAVVGPIDRFGIPEHVTLCDEVVHVNAEFLAIALGGVSKVVTGATVNIDSAPRDRGRGSYERPRQASVSKGTDWVVLMTDSGARSGGHPYYAAVGRPGNGTAAVRLAAWADYQKSATGSDDVRRANQHSASSRNASVKFPRNGSEIGTRHTTAGDLYEGEVVWVDALTSGGETEVRKISRSYLWRSAGKGSLGERVPPWAKPCSDHTLLCNTCRVFGSADVENNDDDGAADQRSYAGHVRIGDSIFDPNTVTQTVRLAPLGAPRLGAGQFTLQNRPGNHLAGKPELQPLRNWGSPLDSGGHRLVRGRKYYWQGDPKVQHPQRSDPYDGGGGENNMISEAEVVPTNATFSSMVTFENLSLPELGGLLASVQPSLVLKPVTPVLPGTKTPIPGTADPVIHARIGGGKPFGFGTVSMHISDFRVHTASSRYLNEDPPEVTINDAVVAFVTDVNPISKEIWPDLTACLQMHHVDPTKISYPPSQSLSNPAKAVIAKTFWKNSSGHLKPMVSLPGPPRNINQYMTIVKEN